MDFVWISGSAGGKRDAKKAAAVRRRSAIAGALLALLTIAAPAAASPTLGTPDPVAPGVPGYGRAWELVTPAEPVAGRPTGPFGASPLTGFSRSGDRVSFYTAGTLPEAVYGGAITNNMAVRGPDGWVSTPLRAPIPEATEVFALEGPVAFDPELTSSVWVNDTAPEAYRQSLFFRAEDGSYRQIEAEGVTFVAASTDLARIVFTSPEHLLPADATRTEGASIYEVEAGALRLVDVDNGGAPVSSCGSELRAGEVSTDARRIYFSATPICGPKAESHLYLRAGGHTTDVSACALPDCGPAGSASFLGMTRDGTVAFFSTPRRLTAADTNSLPDVYRYDAASGELSLLFLRQAGATETPISVRAPAAGPRVYVLAERSTPPGSEVAPDRSLYVVEAGTPHFLASVPPPEFGPGNPIEVSADGRYELFAAAEPLLASDTDDKRDVYLRDALSGALTRISAGPDGRGNGPLDSSLIVGPFSQPVTTPDISNRVFFSSAEQLLPEDRNDQSDVYEWTPAGGLGLVSAGTPGFNGEYLGATPDGRSVLIRTGATLLRRDRDGGELDLYEARIGGGFPEPATAAPCESEACEAPGQATVHRGLRPAVAGRSRLVLARVDAAARRQLAATGATTLLAEVPAAGRLSARARARVGSRLLTAASGKVEAKRPGPLRLRLRLTTPARRALARGGRLRVDLELRLSTRKGARKAAFTLRSAP